MLSGRVPLRDRGPGTAIGLSNGSSFVRHFVYVDILKMMGCSKDELARKLSEFTSIFEKVGLAVHGLEMSSGEMKAPDVELDSRLLSTSLTRERYWGMYGALSHFLMRRKAIREMLEVLIGHCTYEALVRRPVLSLFHCVYRLILVERGKQVVLWPSVTEELQVFWGLMSFLSSDRWLRWNLPVSASDASTNGNGVSTSMWTPD